MGWVGVNQLPGLGVSSTNSPRRLRRWADSVRLGSAGDLRKVMVRMRSALTPRSTRLSRMLRARRSPSARVYSSVPRSSQWPSTSTLFCGLPESLGHGVDLVGITRLNLGPIKPEVDGLRSKRLAVHLHVFEIFQPGQVHFASICGGNALLTDFAAFNWLPLLLPLPLYPRIDGWQEVLGFSVFYSPQSHHDQRGHDGEMWLQAMN